MGLNSRISERGGGNRATLQGRSGQISKLMGQKSMIRSTTTGVFFPPGYFGGPAFHFVKPRPEFSKYPPNYFRSKIAVRSNNVTSPEIDLTKPCVTEEVKNEELKKQELLQTWNNTKSNDDWGNFMVQKHSVQLLHEKSKSNYAFTYPSEAKFKGNVSTAHQYYCETCDKSFRGSESLILHENQHETCGRDGCNFTAHPKIIAKHIKMQHTTGLYKRIGKLYTEEDIAKWIEERKRRYPTRKVVEEKKKLEQEKFNRGERIKVPDNKFNKSFQNKNKGGKKKLEKRGTTSKNRRRKKKKKNIVPKCIKEEDPSMRKGIPAFLGIKNDNLEALNDNYLNISDEEWETEQTVVKPILNNSLGLLATLYDSDEENQNENLNQETKVECISNDEGSGPEEVKTVTGKKPLPKDESYVFSKKVLTGRKENQRKRRIKTFSNANVENKKIRVTLLEKLLKNEIRHERNVILQSVHYIVKNNFFKT